MKNPPAMRETWVRSLGWEDPLEKGKATHSSMKRQKDRTLKDELPRSVAAQYSIGDQWRNNFRKNEEMEPKQKQYPVVNGTGDNVPEEFARVRECPS